MAGAMTQSRSTGRRVSSRGAGQMVPRAGVVVKVSKEEKEVKIMELKDYCKNIPKKRGELWIDMRRCVSPIHEVRKFSLVWS
jgi:hypothetical protein